MSALQKAFRKYTKETDFCVIGSAKAHIGHTEGAAGIIGIIKVLLSLKHKCIPAMPKFEAINPYIALKNSPFYVNTEPNTWERNSSVPLRAGISSFGFGGAYAHVVIEEHSLQHKTPYNSTLPAIIILSAKNEDRLKEQVQNLKGYLKTNPNVNLYDIAYTLSLIHI